MDLRAKEKIHSTPTSSSGAVPVKQVLRLASENNKEATMYTGRLIDELIQSVQRAEVEAHINREEELIEQFLHHADLLDASYIHVHAGVA